jgi:hypothetical protein
MRYLGVHDMGESLIWWRCACGREQPNDEVACSTCGWMGRGHPGAYEIGVVGLVVPVENERCLACGHLETEYGCRLIRYERVTAGFVATVVCRPATEASRAWATR